MKKMLIKIAGWYGTFAILGAYALNSFGVIESKSLVYQLLNLTGAIGIVIVSESKHVHPSVVLNAVWTVIAAVALVRILA